MQLDFCHKGIEENNSIINNANSAAYMLSPARSHFKSQK